MDGAAKSTEGSERFDDILTRLRSIVDRLEGGNLSLEDSLHSFEQGMELCRRGAAILDAAEKKVEVLLAGPPGTSRTAPFDTRAEAAGDRGGGTDPDGKAPEGKSPEGKSPEGKY